MRSKGQSERSHTDEQKSLFILFGLGQAGKSGCREYSALFTRLAQCAQVKEVKVVKVVPAVSFREKFRGRAFRRKNSQKRYPNYLTDLYESGAEAQSVNVGKSSYFPASPVLLHPFCPDYEIFCLNEPLAWTLRTLPPLPLHA